MSNTDFGEGRIPLPAGGASSTAEDYIHFLSMILHNGLYRGKRILSEESVAAMQVNRVTRDCQIAYTPAEAAGLGYGLGEWVAPDCAGNQSGTWACVPAGERSFFSCSPGLFGSFPWVDNEKKYAGFLLTFGLKSKGRSEKYRELKQLTEDMLKKR